MAIRRAKSAHSYIPSRARISVACVDLNLEGGPAGQTSRAAKSMIRVTATDVGRLTGWHYASRSSRVPGEWCRNWQTRDLPSITWCWDRLSTGVQTQIRGDSQSGRCQDKRWCYFVEAPVADQGPQDVDAAAGEGDHGLSVALSLSTADPCQKLGPQQRADAGHAGDDLCGVVGTEAVLDEPVDLRDLLVQHSHAG